VLHINNCPVLSLGFIEPLLMPPDGRLAIGGPFPLTVGTMNGETESRPRTSAGPLEHLQIAVRIAECGDGTAADEFLNTDSLAILIVNTIDRRQFYQTSLPSRSSIS
jgi:hypothetical protein